MQISKEQPMRHALDDVIDAVNDIGDIGPYVTDAVDDWLDEHPEATTTVQDNSLTTAKYQDGSVTSAKLSNNAVTTEKIADGAVTYDKLHEPDLLMVGGAESVTNDEAITREYLYEPVPDGVGDGLALIESVKGNTLRWNQLVSDSATSVTVQSAHKYVARIGGTATLATSNGTATTVTGGTDNVFDLTAMFGAGNEPATVAEFEALYPLPYYPYDAGSLLPVRMEGVETVAADESWSSQRTIPVSTYFPQGLRSAGIVRDELTETQAITRVGAGTVTGHGAVTVGAQNKYAPLSGVNVDRYSSSSAQPEGAGWVWSDKLGRTISNMGSSQLAIGRTWTSLYAYAPLDADDSIFDQLVGAMVWYQLANPTTTPIDPPLPMSYRTGAGGTERVIVASGTTSAPPVFVTRYPGNLTDLAESIAPRESTIATENHAIGDLIMLGWTLCKATQVIVTGETIEIGTNVTRTSVAAEIAALS